MENSLFIFEFIEYFLFLYCLFILSFRCILLDESWPKGYFRVGSALNSLGKYQESRDILLKGSLFRE